MTAGRRRMVLGVDKTGNAESPAARAKHTVEAAIARLGRRKTRSDQSITTGKVHAVEVDGSTVRWAEMEGTRVLRYSSFHADSIHDAIGMWRKAARPKGTISVVWSGPGIQFRRMRIDQRVTEDVLFPVLANKAVTELGTTFENHVVSGIKLTADAVDAEDLYAVAVVNTEPVSEIWSALADLDDVAVTTSPLVRSEDGLHLSIRWSSATLALIEDGYPVQFRYLDPGGLDWLADALSDRLNMTDTDPVEMTTKVALAKVMPTGEAGDVVRDYIDRLVLGVRQSVNAWSKGGLELPDVVLISGQGTQLPSRELEQAIASRSGLVLRNDEPAAAVDRTPIPPEDNGASYLSVMAALAGEVTPSARLVDRNVEVLRKEQIRTVAKRRKITAIAAAAVLVVALAALPIVVASFNYSSAKSRLATAQSTYSGLSRYVDAGNTLHAGQSAVVSVSGANANWVGVLSNIFATSPAGTSYQSVQITSALGVTTILLNAFLTGGTSFSPVDGWTTALGGLGLQVHLLSVMASGSNQVQVSLNLTGSVGLMKHLAGGGPA